MSLQAHQLSCSRGGHLLFDNLDLKVCPGEALKVSGANGAGKSTLLRALCGLTEPTSGRVVWRGIPIASRPEALHQSLFYSGHHSGLKDDLTASENLRMAATLAGFACSEAQARRALHALGLGAQLDTMAGRLSQGQRRRVTLARLWLAPAPQLLVLDEPFNTLDRTAVAQLCAMLQQLLVDGSVLVYTTHQEGIAEALHHHEVHLTGSGVPTTLSAHAPPAWVRQAHTQLDQPQAEAA